jgi:hypothetical protein
MVVIILTVFVITFLSSGNGWEAKENTGYHGLKHNKPCFDGECSKLIDQQKQAKLQWLQEPSQINGDNLQNL